MSDPHNPGQAQLPEEMLTWHCESLSRLFRENCRHADGERSLPGALCLYDGGRLGLWDQVGVEAWVLQRLRHVLPDREAALIRSGEVGTGEVCGLPWSVFPLRSPLNKQGCLLGIMLLQQEAPDEQAARERLRTWQESAWSHAADILSYRQSREDLATYRARLNLLTTENLQNFNRSQRKGLERDHLSRQLRRVMEHLGAATFEEVIPKLKALEDTAMESVQGPEMPPHLTTFPQPAFPETTTPHQSD